ncbi:hypothetical protein [Fluviispira vulneris]|uniref:hypothetical protein n=1 Tax=Fluviispira vulneris TaxID=2763012 RepID=UPI0016484A57|nr:hypothetical protein [Fluviispira vulneris]
MKRKLFKYFGLLPFLIGQNSYAISANVLCINITDNRDLYIAKNNNKEIEIEGYYILKKRSSAPFINKAFFMQPAEYLKMKESCPSDYFVQPHISPNNDWAFYATIINGEIVYYSGISIAKEN